MSVTYKAILTLLGIAMLNLKVDSQTPSHIRFNVWRGLPSNLVYCSFQDSKGILWFGTDQGLLSYDNHKFRLFGTEEGLPDPEILNIWEDSKKNLWISCFRKKPCYWKDGKFITSNEDLSLSDVEMHLGICNYYEDDNNKVWLLGSLDMIYRLEKDRSTKFLFPDAIMYLKTIEKNLYAFATTSAVLAL